MLEKAAGDDRSGKATDAGDEEVHSEVERRESRAGGIWMKLET